MVKVPDAIELGSLVSKAARALTKAGLEHRIDIYRDVEIEDPVIRQMLGRGHRVRVRIKITAQSLLFSDSSDAVTNKLSIRPRTLAKGFASTSETVEGLPAAAGRVAMKSVARAQ